MKKRYFILGFAFTVVAGLWLWSYFGYNGAILVVVNETDSVFEVQTIEPENDLFVKEQVIKRFFVPGVRDGGLLHPKEGINSILDLNWRPIAVTDFKIVVFDKQQLIIPCSGKIVRGKGSDSFLYLRVKIIKENKQLVCQSLD